VIAKHGTDNVPQPCAQLAITDRLERALLGLAYLIETQGDVHVPMYEEFETKLTELRGNADVRARARQRLQAFTVQRSSPAALIVPETSAT
jgi:hypothetical protein